MPTYTGTGNGSIITGFTYTEHMTGEGVRRHTAAAAALVPSTVDPVISVCEETYSYEHNLKLSNNTGLKALVLFPPVNHRNSCRHVFLAVPPPVTDILMPN